MSFIGQVALNAGNLSMLCFDIDLKDLGNSPTCRCCAGISVQSGASTEVSHTLMRQSQWLLRAREVSS